MDQNCSWGRTEKGPRFATGWRSPPDSTNKRTDGEGQMVAPALQLTSGSGRHEWPPAEQGICLKNMLNKEGAGKVINSQHFLLNINLYLSVLFLSLTINSCATILI